jgi:hypothetical protein
MFRTAKSVLLAVGLALLPVLSAPSITAQAFPACAGTAAVYITNLGSGSMQVDGWVLSQAGMVSGDYKISWASVSGNTGTGSGSGQVLTGDFFQMDSYFANPGSGLVAVVIQYNTREPGVNKTIQPCVYEANDYSEIDNRVCKPPCPLLNQAAEATMLRDKAESLLIGTLSATR